MAPLEMNAGTCWGKNTIDPRGRSVEKPCEATLTFNLLTPGKIVTATKITEYEILIKELVWRVHQCLQKVLKAKGFVDCWKTCNQGDLCSSVMLCSILVPSSRDKQSWTDWHLQNETKRLSRNAGNKLPIHAA
jgi:uncharacterized protein Usg